MRGRADATQVWMCPFCFSRNHFPAHYAEISDSNLPGAPRAPQLPAPDAPQPSYFRSTRA